MFHTYSFYLLTLLSFQICADHKETASLMAHTAFGPDRVDLDMTARFFIETVIHSLLAATPYEQMKACQKAGSLLEKEVQQATLFYHHANQYVRPRSAHNLMILKVQTEHYQRCARLLKQDMSLTTYIQGFFKNIGQYCLKYISFPFKTYQPTITALTQNLYDYAQLERADILVNHQKTLHLLVSQKKLDLPVILRFWDYPLYRHALLNGVKEHETTITPQAAVVAEGAEIVGEELLEQTLGAGAKIGIDDATAGITELVDAEKAIITVTEETGTVASQQAANKAFDEAGNAAIKSGPKAALAEVGDVAAAAEKAGAGVVTAGEDSTKALLATAGKDATPALTEAGKDLTKIAETGNAAAAKAETAIADAAKTPNPPSTVKNFFTNVQKLAHKVEEECTPLEKAFNASKQLKGIFSKLGNNLEELFAGSPLKTGVDKVANYIEDTALAKAYEGSGVQSVFKGIAKPLSKAVDLGSSLIAKLNPAKALEWFLTSKNTMVQMARTMLEQTEVTMGTQMVASWQEATDAEEFTKIAQQKNALTTQLTQFFANLSVVQQTALANIKASASAKTAAIAAQFSPTVTSGAVVLQGLLPTTFAREKSLLTQSMIETTVKDVFLTDPISNEQDFFYSPMFTPSNGNATWYNPYRNYNGTWLFSSTDFSGYTDKPITSFVQLQTIPIPFTNDGNINGSTATQNCIFSDYIPAASYDQTGVESYQITIACTFLAKPLQPFMAGIIFNGARWVSGITDFHNQQRLFCLYTTKDQKPGTCNVGFAETFYRAPGDLSDQGSANLLPTDRIINAVPPAIQLFTPEVKAAAKQGTNVIPNPLGTIPLPTPGVPYIFVIQTQANQVSLSILQVNKDKTTTLIWPTKPATLEKLNHILYFYHSIGFISAGCCAQFIINEPANLTYNSSQLEQFSNLLKSGQAVKP